MNGEKNKQLAKDIEDSIPSLLAGMTAVLVEHGFEGIEVVGFSVGERSPDEPSRFMAMADGTPCPVRCVPMPDGSVRCRPQC